MNNLKITEDILDITAIINSVSSKECGAISIFIGTTRDNCLGKKVKKLYYEAYESMALNQMKSIIGTTKEKWPEIANIAIHHRCGEVKVGEVGLVIAVSSPHSKESHDVVAFILNKIKTIVPIFKKEFYEEGGNQWKSNDNCSW
ncbi:molybdopterin synthase catalytic subunit [Daktulosphaira vitifoliae]|uniref:molybdopterin synthase catalytic subunit n=1 Tax=Daktulosphaira vitifoliae TaxID=58002 RepID=UPI0021AAC15B|nr:molybdopterin synthase catalytic subunit [Daktulosphaira vitifoliae]